MQTARAQHLALALLLAAAILSVTAPARAAERVEWSPDWPRFRWSEGVVTAGLVTASYVEDKTITGPSSPHWTGPILLDSPIRGLLRGRSDHLQRVATKYADVNLTLFTFFPYLDVAIALGVHGSVDVASQIFLINAQSQSFTSSLTILTKWAVGRQRPYVRDCGAAGVAGVHSCGTSYDNISFFSGHTSAAFTGAALTCTHHAHLPLYGGGLPDDWACLWAMTGATFTAVLRIVSDDHYASDVVVASGIGLLSGYVLPSLLHYGFGRGMPAKRRMGRAEVMPTLLPIQGGLGLGVAGSM